MGRFLFRWRHFLITGLAFAAALAGGSAQAAFILTPLRQVITADAPRATYVISNPSGRTIDARISWIDLKAVETGYAPAPTQLRERMSAAPYLIVSPTFLTLEPGARETITVSLRGGAKPPKGERRSHLLIESDAGRTLLRKASGGIQLDLDTAISTPVILRGGGGNAKAKISDTRLLRNKDGGMDLETMIEPHGSRSAYGFLTASFKPKTGPNAGRESEIARIENIAAYPEAPRRKVVFPLHVTRFEEGVLTLRYVGSSEYTGMTFDKRAFQVGAPEE